MDAANTHADDPISTVAAISPRWRWLNRLLIALAFGVLFVFGLDFPTSVADSDLDLSWAKCMAHFYRHSAQAGVDFIFTRGPLGYFSTKVYDTDLFWPAYVWEIFIALFFAATVVRFCRRINNLWLSAALVAVVILADSVIDRDNFYATIMLLTGALWMLPAAGKRRWVDAAGVLVVALISLMKFTYFIQAGMILFFAELAWRSTRPRSLWSPLIVFIPSIGVAWVIARQNLLNLPKYLIASSQIAAGYANAMGWEDPDTQRWIPFAAALVAMVLLALGVFLFTRRLTLPRLAAAGLIAVNIWLGWKHGIVRADACHFSPMLGLCAILTLLIPMLLGGKSPETRPQWKRIGRAVAVAAPLLLAAFLDERVLAVAGNPYSWRDIGNDLRIAAGPRQFRQNKEDEQNQLAEQFALPRIAAVLGDAPVDFISSRQGVLFLNHFNYRWRPIFQSQEANNSFLIHKNAEFYAGPNAAAFVLIFPETIDEKLFTAQDNQTLFELACRYTPVVFEKGYWLLKRRATPVADIRSSPISTTAARLKWDQNLTLPASGDGFQTLTVRINPSIRGRLRTALYKQAQVYLQVTGSDGQSRRFRLIPSMADEEFLINPLITEDIIPLYVPASGVRVSAISFSTNAPAGFDPEIGLEIRTYSNVSDPAVANRLRYPMMMTTPVQVDSSDARSLPFVDGGDQVLMVQAPATVHFKCETGNVAVTGKFGILPGAYAVTDGVTFQVQFQPVWGNAQTLFERTLYPHDIETDRGLFDLSVSCNAPTPGEILLRTFSPPGKGAGCEWSCWTQIQVSDNAAAPATALSADAEISGSLDVANLATIDGWVWDDHHKEAALTVQLLDGDEAIATTVANLPRADLTASGVGSHGFHFDVPSRLKDGRPHSVHAKVAGQELNYSPMTVGGTAATQPQSP